MTSLEHINSLDNLAFRRSRLLVVAASAISTAIGLAVLFGWTVDLNVLKTIIPSSAPVKANTAICFLLAGLALWLLRKDSTSFELPRASHRYAAMILAAVLLLFGSGTIMQDLLGIDLKIDQAFFHETHYTSHTSNPGRMAPGTALGLLLIGANIFFLSSRRPKLLAIANLISLVTIFVGFLACLGYLFQIEALYRIQAYSTMAPATACLLVLLGGALLFARPESTFAATILSAQGGGLISRRILPFAIALPCFLGWLRLAGERAGFYGSDFGVALVATTNIILFSTLTWLTARRLNRVDQQRSSVVQSLRQSEERLRLLIDSVKDYAIFMLGPDGQVLTWNSGARRLKGYEAREIVGYSFNRFYPLGDVAAEKPQKELQFASERGHYEDEGWRIRKDGSRFWANVLITAIHDEGGGLIGFAKVTRDLTERKQAEDSLARQAALINQTYDAVLAWKWNGPITFWNRGAERIYGFPSDQALGRVSHELLKTVATPDIQTVLSALERNGSWEGELEHTTKDNRRITVESRIVLVRDPAGDYVLETNRDITQRKRDEIALRESQLRIAGLVDSAMDAIITVDSQQNIVLFNRSAEKMFGHTAASVLGQSMEQLIPSASRCRHAQHVRQFGETGNSSRKMGALGSISGVRANGEEFPIEASISHIEVSGQKFFTVILRDITERKRAEEALKQANESLECKVAERTVELEHARHRAERADRLKSEFLANMSHEIRTPLNGIIGFTEFLVDKKAGELNAKQLDFLGDVLTSARHLLQLINDILDLAKVEAGKIELYPAEFSPASAAAEVCAVVKGIASKKRIFVETNFSPEVGQVTLDQNKFKQVLYNLLSNAVKFTPAGGQVRLSIQPVDGGRFRVEVRDSGDGIVPEELDEVFKEFKRSKSASVRDVEGTGLGLSLSKKIVEFQHGSITVKSQPGQGCTFSVVLPQHNGAHQHERERTRLENLLS